MELFSQRRGIRPARTTLQIDSMDDALRNGLWNVVYVYCLEPFGSHPGDFAGFPNVFDPVKEVLRRLIVALWVGYFKKPVDVIPWYDILGSLKDYFFQCQWFEVYDFVEFVVDRYPFIESKSEFVESCNETLNREMSAYRCLNGRITPITSEEEIATVEHALTITDATKPVAAHLGRALELLSDRKSPDYRNSVKESISAVEALCRILTGNDRATLGQALNEMERQSALHPALKSSFSSLLWVYM